MTRRRSHQTALAAIICAFAAVMTAVAPIPARTADFGAVAGGARPSVPIASFADRKFKTIVRQQYDFSCGSAALATLLTHHYGRPTTEREAFETMWRVGDQARIRKLGFSMLEMKSFLETHGYRADGFRMTLDKVAEVGVPGIALVEVKGYRHFVVVKGVTPESVLVGDPAKGLVVRGRREFQSHWDGTILFIRSNVAVGKTAFNQHADWSLAPDAPFGRALDVETLQSLAINQTRPSFSALQQFE